MRRSRNWWDGPWGGFAFIALPLLAPLLSGGVRQSGIPLADNLLMLLAVPEVAYLLFVVGLLGLAGELVTPGAVVPGAIGAVCIILGLIGLRQLPTNWGGVVLIVVAVIMFLLDIHVPGYALSVGGVIAFLCGSLLLFTPFWAASPDGRTVSLSPWVVLGTTLSIGAFFILGIAMALRNRNAPPAVGRETMVGKMGQVRQELHPVGIVHVEGEEWTAVSADGAPIAVGEHVRVVGTDGLRLRVEPDLPLDLAA